MIDKAQLILGRLLLVGVLISFLIVAVGGALYLSSHGSELASYQEFQDEPLSLKSISGIFQGAFSSPLGLIQLGLLSLILLQLLRVALTAFYFIKLQDKFFALISLFILAVLIYSLLGSVHG